MGQKWSEAHKASRVRREWRRDRDAKGVEQDGLWGGGAVPPHWGWGHKCFFLEFFI